MNLSVEYITMFTSIEMMFLYLYIYHVEIQSFMPHLLYSLTYLVYPTFGKQDPGHGVLKKLTGETMAKVFIS